MAKNRINDTCSTNENCKKEVIDAKKFAKKVKRQKNIHTVAHFDLPKSTQKMIDNPHDTITEMITHNKICRNIIEKNNGKIIKELGDAVLATFKNSGIACECAIKVIRNLKNHGSGMQTKVTITTGTIETVTTDKKDDIYGIPVNLCNRMSKHAKVDSILIEDSRYRPIKDWLQGARNIIYCKSNTERLNDFGDVCLRKIMVK